MSRLTIAKVVTEDRGRHKKIKIIIEGIVTEAEAQRCEELMKRTLLDRTMEFPDFVPTIGRSRSE